MKMRLFVLSIVAVSLVGCTATPTKRTFSEAWRDGIVTGTVKMEMSEDELVQARNINIDTWRGVVTLVGRVTSEKEKLQAETIAKNTKNVRGVRNYLDIVHDAQPLQVVTKESAKFSKPRGQFKSTNRIAPPVIKVEEKRVAKKPAATENKKVDTGGKKPFITPEKGEDSVSYQIRSDLAANDSRNRHMSDDDIISQAEKELEELKRMKKEKKSP